MTDVLYLPARPGSPIACDMSTASDTPEERLSEYARLVGRALVRRERTEDAVVFAFRAAPGVREQVEDLARREAACCPFLEYRVETTGEDVIFTIANAVTGGDRTEAAVTLGAFYRLAG